ncbi:FG-GAP-like repeat-containing protein [Aporhodopirellula aestuarii]|uniref:FG-GAP-like repeat-containing protein n=1 Tax=Aporhodopirellula aestuarii TaxID=2950107 RepID=A0ABT0TZF6_9BACT|nr:FG-GAP-like repeat-containing protein [Aporhodopirellula aestuarii]MCM2369982.1 FG-GAP-like repeat-containing protein [Aporhodopirellula aestuarii]
MRSRIWRYLLVGALLSGCDRAPDTVSPLQVPRTIEGSAVAPRPDEVEGAIPHEIRKSATRDRGFAIATADQLAAEGDLAGASKSLQSWLLVKPNDVEVLFRLANVRAASGQLNQAIELLDEIPEGHPEAGLPALGQSADWCFHLQRYDEAERRYRKVIEKVPSAIPPRRQLAYLLNRQGRRHEAAVQLYELCRHGDVHQDELHALVILTDAMYDDPSRPDELKEGTLPYWPIGECGKARRLFALQQYNDVIAMLHDRVKAGDAMPAELAIYGRAVAEAQDDERFLWWLARVDSETKEFADYWAAVGAHEARHRRFDGAVRALAEALKRDPSDFLSMGRIRQPLIALGQSELADRWTFHWSATRDAMKFNNQIAGSDDPNVDAMGELSASLSKLGRRLEAVLWKTIESGYRGVDASEIKRLNGERRQLVASGIGFPTQEERLCGMDLERYPIPQFDSRSIDALQFDADEKRETKALLASFPNVADEVGLKHMYRVSAQPVSRRYSIHQTLGGGVAVIDFDLDGLADLAFAQGASDPPAFQADRSNQLFRNTGTLLVDVTNSSGTTETQYSLGMASGDWNQDGFPDLAVSNIGTSTLLINNGDGTFTRQMLSQNASRVRVPSSIAIADLDGDHLPDLFHCVYVDDPRIDRKPPLDASGRVVRAVSPGDYRVGADEVFLNDGMGGMHLRPIHSQDRDESYGLGVIVTDLDRVPGNEIFVGNDLLPNQLWTHDVKSHTWNDVATLKGCAFDASGVATGSMGIAIGDFDSTGTLDIHISNYEHQNASHFLSERDAYQDRSIPFQIAEPTRSLVGFGTQAIDFDNDGHLDLMVTNGHLDDSVENRSSFHQPPQLFANLGSHFQPAEVVDSSGYWDARYLGRGLARLDFNRDGKNDAVVTHIGQRSALLINQTPTENHWLQIQLVGTESERDAIGAEVRVRCGERETVDWAAAGDGYLCRNESAISFGLGPAMVPVEVEVRWPTGKRQVHGEIGPDQRILIVENEPEHTVLF